MKKYLIAAALAVPMVLGAATAQAQPSSKLINGLDKSLIAEIWCSALFFEESFWHDSDTERAYYYEDLAYLLEDEMHQQLLDSGLGEPEIAEIWEVLDEAAMALASDSERAYRAQLASCESQYRMLLPLPKD